MLSDEKRNRFFQLLRESTKEEWVWMNGYLSAMMQPMLGSDPVFSEQVPNERVVPNVVSTSAISSAKLTISVVYGTETGNAKKLATQFVKQLKDLGHNAKLKSTETYKANELDQEKNLIVVVSTHGDGDPPNAAKKFVETLKERTSPLKSINFAVLGLGDTSYPLFCKTGEDVDQELSRLGGTRIQSLGKCDLDIESVATPWFQSLSQKLGGIGVSSGAITKEASPVAKAGGRIIYAGRISQNIVLNDTGATKSVRHIEITCDSEIDYEPGDSAGFFPKNTEADVNRIVSLLNVDSEDRVSFSNETWMLKDLLKNKVSIRNLPKRVLEKYQKAINAEIASGVFDLDELLTQYPWKGDVQALVDILESMVPRYYSISSSKKAHGDTELHLTVAEVEIKTSIDTKAGLCSGFLSEMQEGESVEFYIQKNPNFRLPSDETPIIMIGPGTGIAPFRSFVWEREANQASGKNWLFFGERNFVSDFYYQAEFLQLMETGVLQKLNTAFSRDTKKKVYVQDRMRENTNELLKWIQEGACIYVCGSKDPMSKDVERALIEILSQREFDKDKSPEEYLNQLEEAGRYKKDVY
ncbi:sulfite reductase subunit beta [Leptospira ryugenii]|uniref:assimilatory sulfite reductase (NADPH) n=2 Tax=Leptospira ryugenii TaxID=1917863 RepID=A0A2P2DVJ0_9LEPT|nr:sulfite reductase subunit beta [Leptospira ryugenii]